MDFVNSFSTYLPISSIQLSLLKCRSKNNTPCFRRNPRAVDKQTNLSNEKKRIMEPSQTAFIFVQNSLLDSVKDLLLGPRVVKFNYGSVFVQWFYKKKGNILMARFLIERSVVYTLLRLGSRIHK